MKRVVRFIIVILYILVASYGCYNAWKYGSHFFLYFTNLGNLYCLALMINELVRLIRRKSISLPLLQWEFAGLITIIVISVVYNLLLGDPTSPSYWANKPSVCLHLITPMLYTFYILTTRPIRKVNVGGVQSSILLPYLYVAFIYVRHFITGDNWFPYFFLDLNRIGWSGALCWIIGLTVIFALIGIVFIYIGRRRTRTARRL